MIGLHIFFAIIVNHVSTTTVFVSLRTYFRYFPFFFLPGIVFYSFPPLLLPFCMAERCLANQVRFSLWEGVARKSRVSLIWSCWVLLFLGCLFWVWPFCKVEVGFWNHRLAYDWRPCWRLPDEGKYRYTAWENWTTWRNFITNQKIIGWSSSCDVWSGHY